MADYMSIAEARDAEGLRMACIRGVPSPWTEAARGIFRVKGLACRYAAPAADEPADAVAEWAGDTSVPVVAYAREKLRTGWAEILLLAERLAPEPALIPAEPEERAMLFGLGHEICGEMGLGWCVRLLMVERSLEQRHASAFPNAVAEMLASKYGYEPDAAARARDRVPEILAMLDARLARSPFLLGERLTAADIYWATFANLLTPLPEADMPAIPAIRAAYAGSEPWLLEAVTERLRTHQRTIYDRYLELPVPL
ncbi:MAG: glutathione S-transferase family protein [Pseudomonadota bacterium]